MTADVSVQRHDEIDVVRVEALTEAGEDFVNGFLCSEMEVVDSGRIVIPARAEDALWQQAGEGGVSVEVA